jgi:hypothetical protein
MPNFTPIDTILNKQAFQGLLELDQKERTQKSREGYTMAYLWSVLFPPIGLFYLVKYLFFANGTRDDIRAGIISCILTFISLFLSIGLMGLLFKQSSSLIPKENSEMMKELLTPQNAQDLRNLYK